MRCQNRRQDWDRYLPHPDSPSQPDPLPAPIQGRASACSCPMPARPACSCSTQPNPLLLSTPLQADCLPSLTPILQLDLPPALVPSSASQPPARSPGRLLYINCTLRCSCHIPSLPLTQPCDICGILTLAHRVASNPGSSRGGCIPVWKWKN